MTDDELMDCVADRINTDRGVRHDLDDVIHELGIDDD